MRILGLDFGEKRIGVAVSDELDMTAQGVATIVRKNNKQVMEELRQIINRYLGRANCYWLSTSPGWF